REAREDGREHGQNDRRRGENAVPEGLRLGWSSGGLGKRELGEFHTAILAPVSSTLLLAAGKRDDRLELLVRLNRAWFQLANPIDRDLGCRPFMNQVGGQHCSGAAQSRAAMHRDCHVV